MVDNTSANCDCNTISGSPLQGEPAFLVIGRIRKPHGVRGEMDFEVITDFPERIKTQLKVFVGKNKKQYLIKTVRPSLLGLLISFSGIDKPEDASLLNNQYIYVENDALPELPTGHYYHHDLIGITVFDSKGVELGKITEIISTGSNDVYIVRREHTPDKEILIPAIRSVITDIDLTSHIMKVNPPEWL